MNTEITVPKLNTYFDIEQYYLKNRLDVPGVEAMARLAVVAHYLNGGWVSTGYNRCSFLLYSYWRKKIYTSWTVQNDPSLGNVMFKDKTTALKAVEILGVETIIAALTIGS